MSRRVNKKALGEEKERKIIQLAKKEFTGAELRFRRL